MDFGSFVGVHSERAVVRQDAKSILEVPLSRLKSISIAKNGVSLSSDLILACSIRGIHIYFLDFKGQAVASVSGLHAHGAVAIRKAQIHFCEAVASRELAKKLVTGKLKNQRAVLKYFGKYHRKNPESENALLAGVERLEASLEKLNQQGEEYTRDYQSIMGIEGSAAAGYWQALRDARLLDESFDTRTGRGATDPTNQLLNYGYSILLSHVWRAVVNAGLEPYLGVLHRERSGKPSLVLDLMEEYRPYVVDRSVIALRQKTGQQKNSELNSQIRKKLVQDIHDTLERKFPYLGKKVRLETLMQRQVYRLAGCFAGSQKYKPYIFPW